MLLVDPRAGSEELIEPLRRLGIEVDAVYLPAGDLAFEAHESDGHTVQFGIEFKKIPDAVASLRSGRLSGHQAPGMLGPNGIFDVAIIIIEGEWDTNKFGLLTQPHWRGKKINIEVVKGKMPTSEWLNRLRTLEFTGGFHVWHSSNRRNTLSLISSVYRWATDKSFDRHTSLLAPHKPAGVTPISRFRRLVVELPDVGLKASAAIDREFGGSLLRACQAPVSRWAEIRIQGAGGKERRLGQKAAERIVAFITKGESR